MNGAVSGNIEIIQKGITDIPADCVVNAANERLLEGGGVCGYIFKAAGSYNLTEACRKIGYCECGSAVITPAFDLPAKYIIHAVGPRYADGKHGEPEKLYSCYQSSLELVKEYGCHSIVFPLISAGIFGYPEKDAAKKAFGACRDFLMANADYKIDIMFAIPSERINSMAKQVLKEIDFQDPADKADLSGKSETAVNKTGIIGFHLPEEPYGCFSNWANTPFNYAGYDYISSEQYMMTQKVLLGGRWDLADKIREATSQEQIKEYSGPAYFAEYGTIKHIWEKNRMHIVKQGVKAKFKQNPECLKQLFATGKSILCESSKSDTVWGVGINLHDPAWKDVNNWKGQNLLGRILMEVREELRMEQKILGEIKYQSYVNASRIPEWEMTFGELRMIPQYYNAVHCYCDKLTTKDKQYVYHSKFYDIEAILYADMGGTLPGEGFYEMKQEIYEIANLLR